MIISDNMFCPYVFDVIEQITQSTTETDESGRSFMECKFIEKRTRAKCDPSTCGAYDRSKDRCMYQKITTERK